MPALRALVPIPHHPASEPLQVPTHHVELELGLVDYVSLTRVHHHRDRHVAPLERRVELVALRDRHPQVVLTVLDERRRRHGLHVTHRGASVPRLSRATVPRASLMTTARASRVQPTMAGRRSKLSASGRAVPSAGETRTTRKVRAYVGGVSETVTAIQRPSGDHATPPSAAGVAAKGRTRPVATSTTDTSARTQSSPDGDGEWEKAIAEPSGDHSNAAPLSPAPRCPPTCRCGCVSGCPTLPAAASRSRR